MLLEAGLGSQPFRILRRSSSWANKGVTLGQLERSEEEVGAYGEVVARFGDAPEPALREQVARALVNKEALRLRGHPPDQGM